MAQRAQQAWRVWWARGQRREWRSLRAWRSRRAWGGVRGVLGVLGAMSVLCASIGCGPERTGEVVERGPAPAYAAAARAYNERADRLGRVWARAVVTIRYVDTEGVVQREQGEGHLQLLRPGKVAVSVGKVGTVLLWLGSDGTRWWWIDLTGDARVARVGRRGEEPAALALVPGDLFALTGTAPLPASGGATQWSADGQLLGLTSVRPAARPGAAPGVQRLWVDPATYEPVGVELYDAARRLELVSKLDDPDYVLMRGEAGSGPRMATSISVHHPASDTEVYLRLGGMEDGRVSEGAFDLSRLLDELRVDRVVDAGSAR